MDRRKYLKTLAVSTAGAGLLLQGCDDKPKVETAATATPEFTIDRYDAEKKRDLELMADKFFDEHEMKTIKVLADIIIPKDEVSGSATEAGVHDFIEFIVKDMPRYQIPLRGGLRWLDLQSMKRFNTDFASATSPQQIEIIDDIAYPEEVKPELQQGAAFFNTMRDLTACGFFSSKIGIKDLGYAGNQPNQWNGVPAEVLAQYGVKYDQRTLDISVTFDS
jgi:hypothetical protein